MSSSNFDDRRVHPRCSFEGSLEITIDDHPGQCKLNDISISAVSVITERPLAVGESAIIELPALGRIQARVVRVAGNMAVLDLVRETQAQRGDVEILAQALG